MTLFVGASESYDTDAWEAYNLKKENAKLREVVRDYERCMNANCDRCEHYGTTSTHCPLSPCFPDIDEHARAGN